MLCIFTRIHITIVTIVIEVINQQTSLGGPIHHVPTQRSAESNLEGIAFAQAHAHTTIARQAPEAGQENVTFFWGPK